MSGESPPVRLTVSGSFQRHLAEVQLVMQQLESAGATLPSPRTTRATGVIDGFVLLDGDNGSPADLERAHLAAIRSSDALYVVDPGGYIGASVSLEIGFALALGIPVFAQEAPARPPHNGLVRVATPDEAVELAKRSHEHEPPAGISLGQLQRHLATTARARGFGQERASDLLILLIEEIGELARFIRVHSGIERADVFEPAEAELADCLIYLLLIAEKLDVDAGAAVRSKERGNAARYPLLRDSDTTRS